jgi:hypothetical protein
MNWTNPRMFELLLLDRPRKPVGPEDAIFAGASRVKGGAGGVGDGFGRPHSFGCSKMQRITNTPSQVVKNKFANPNPSSRSRRSFFFPFFNSSASWPERLAHWTVSVVKSRAGRVRDGECGKRDWDRER